MSWIRKLYQLLLPLEQVVGVRVLAIVHKKLSPVFMFYEEAMEMSIMFTIV